MSPKSGTRCPAEEVERWIAEAHGGSEIALNRLLGLCRPYLLATANKEIGAALRVRVSPSDLVQNTLLEAYHDFPSFQGRAEEDWLAWLRQILHHNLANEIRRHIRAAKRSINREVPLSEVASAALPDIARNGAKSPSAREESRERREALKRSLGQLPEHPSGSLSAHV